MAYVKLLTRFLCLTLSLIVMASIVLPSLLAAYNPSPRELYQGDRDDPPPPPPPDGTPPTAMQVAIGSLWWASPSPSSIELFTSPLSAPYLQAKADPQAPSQAEVLSLAPPSNDDFDHALSITSVPYLSEIDTTEATTAADDPVIPCGSRSVPAQSNTVWYRFVARNDGQLHAETRASTYDTVMAIWTGNRGALLNVGCNDDYSGLISQLDINVTKGITYHVEVADLGHPGGGFLSLRVDFRPLGGTMAWYPVADLPNDRDRLAVVSDGAYVYAIGGEEYAGSSYPTSQSNQRYDPLSNTWNNRSPMPTGYRNMDAAYLDGRIYIPAGYGNTGFIGTHYVYNVTTDSWTTAPSAPWASTTVTPVVYYAVAADPANNVYYVAGGYNGTDVTNELLRYDAGSDTWSVMAPMQTARYGHEAAFTGDSLYVAGGANASFSSMTSAERYDPATNSWSYVADMNVDRMFAANGSELTGIGHACSGGVLLVDDDWNMEDAEGGRPFYTDALDHIRVPYTVWDVVSLGRSPQAADMAPFDAVIWFTGYAYWGGLFTTTDEASVAAYLNSGGAFLLSSEDYLYESGLSSFGQTYLGVQGHTEDTNRTDPVGATGHPIGHGLGPYILQSPSYWPENTFYTDDVLAAGAATTPFRWQGTGIGNSSARRTGTYRTLFLAWPLETIADTQARAELLQASLNWLCKGDGLWYITGGGFSEQGYYLNTTEAYDPLADTWTLLNENLYNLHEPRRHFNGAVTGAGAFYVVGGTTGDPGEDGDYLSAIHERMIRIRSLSLPVMSNRYCPSADPYEPNNTFSQAYPISSNMPYQGNFACPDDINDVFFFQLDALHAIEIWLTNIPAGSNFSLALYDANKQRIEYSSKPGNADEHILTGTMASSQYYVQVYNQGGTFVPGVTYQLRAVFQ